MEVVGTCKDLRSQWNAADKENKSIPSALFYTIGQSAKISNAKEKYFVVDVVPSTNTVLVCPGSYHSALFCDTLTVKIKDMNWMARNECPLPLLSSQPSVSIGMNSSFTLGGSLRAQCRIRHLQPLVDCTIRFGTDKDNYNVNEKDCYQIYFDSPLRGVTPGQMIVFYVLDGLVCLGGGIIHQRGRSYFEQNKYLDLEKIHPDR